MSFSGVGFASVESTLASAFASYAAYAARNHASAAQAAALSALQVTSQVTAPTSVVIVTQSQTPPRNTIAASIAELLGRFTADSPAEASLSGQPIQGSGKVLEGEIVESSGTASSPSLSLNPTHRFLEDSQDSVATRGTAFDVIV